MRRLAIVLLFLVAPLAHAVVDPTCPTGQVVVNGACVVVSLTVTPAPAGGVVTSDASATINCGTACTKTFSAVTTVHLYATPGAGYNVGDWGGACAGAPATDCTVTVDSVKTVSKTFPLADRKVTISTPCPVRDLATGNDLCTTGRMYLYWDKYGASFRAGNPGDPNQVINWTGSGNIKKFGGMIYLGQTTPSDVCLCGESSGIPSTQFATNPGAPCNQAKCQWVLDPATQYMKTKIDLTRCDWQVGPRFNDAYFQIYYNACGLKWTVTPVP